MRRETNIFFSEKSTQDQRSLNPGHMNDWCVSQGPMRHVPLSMKHVPYLSVSDWVSANTIYYPEFAKRSLGRWPHIKEGQPFRFTDSKYLLLAHYLLTHYFLSGKAPRRGQPATMIPSPAHVIGLESF